ncbi:MAG: DUF6491 family protein [Alteraurantiacibacter sp.]
MTRFSLLVALVPLAACTSTPQTEVGSEDAFLAQVDISRACFNRREVRGYEAARDASGSRERILLDTGLEEIFVLETTGPCPGLDLSLRVALDQRGIGNICTGDFERIVLPRGQGQDLASCPVRVIGRLVPK